MKARFWFFFFVLLALMVLSALAIESVLRQQKTDQTPWLPAIAVICQHSDAELCAQWKIPLQHLPDNAVNTPSDSSAVFATRTDKGAHILARVDQQWLMYGPVPLPSHDEHEALLLYLLFFGVFALVLALALWPIFRDMDHVRQQLARSKEGDALRFALPRRSTLQPLTQTITDLSLRSQALLQNQRELSQFIAHDLRTPLARMRFAVAMLETPNTDLRADLLANIAELERTATDYLRFANVGGENVQLSEIDSASWWKEIQALYHHSEKQILWPPSSPLRFYAQAFALQRALCNVIDNALQYAENRVHIHLRVRLGCCVLMVDDDGPGIPPAARDQFGRARQQMRVNGSRQQGFGIGLYIVKQVALLHRGKLLIRSAPNGGARFILIWPNRA